MANPNLSFPFVQKHLKTPPDWSQKPLLAWSDAYPADCRSFLTEHYEAFDASVNVFNVVGTLCKLFQNKTWLDLLQDGSKIATNLDELQRNPDYYLNLVSRVPAMQFYTTDGLSFYVGHDGNHRTCLAKFFLFDQSKSHLHSVAVEHFLVNWPFYAIYKQLKELIAVEQLPYELTAASQRIGYNDGVGWRVVLFQPSLTLLYLNSSKTITLNYDQAQAKLAEFQALTNASTTPKPSLWKRLFRRCQTIRIKASAIYFALAVFSALPLLTGALTKEVFFLGSIVYITLLAKAIWTWIKEAD